MSPTVVLSRAVTMPGPWRCAACGTRPAYQRCEARVLALADGRLRRERRCADQVACRGRVDPGDAPALAVTEADPGDAPALGGQDLTREEILDLVLGGGDRCRWCLGSRRWVEEAAAGEFCCGYAHGAVTLRRYAANASG